MRNHHWACWAGKFASLLLVRRFCTMCRRSWGWCKHYIYLKEDLTVEFHKIYPLKRIINPSKKTCRVCIYSCSSFLRKYLLSSLLAVLRSTMHTLLLGKRRSSRWPDVLRLREAVRRPGEDGLVYALGWRVTVSSIWQVSSLSDSHPPGIK